MEGLGINLPGLVTQIVSFLVLFVILYALLYKPLLGLLDQRAAKIKESLERAENVKQAADDSQMQMEEQLKVARTEGQSLIAQAREVAEKYRQNEMAKAKTEIQAEREKAQEEIRRERDAAIDEVRDEFADLAIQAAEKVINKSLDQRTHQDLIQNVLDESKFAKEKK
jgi:F-type H+-transporting ATPase subunit b